MAAGWEPRNDSNQNEGTDFLFGAPDPVLPATFQPVGDSTKVFSLGRKGGGSRTQYALYLKYTKGTESYLEVRVRYRNKKSGEFFEQAFVNGATGEAGATRPRFTATGNYRIMLPVTASEAAVEVAIRGDIAGTGSGYLIPATEDGA